MRTLTPLLVIFALATPSRAPRSTFPQAAGVVARAGVDAFNSALSDATRRMDDSAAVALWEDDGISLLPSTQPIVGKQAIAGVMRAVSAAHPGAHMESFTMVCHDIDVAGDWASEWCGEHQVVSLAGDQRFDGWGKMLLVLHRAADGSWRLRREMWNQASSADSVAIL